MGVVIRLANIGCTRTPFYYILAADSRYKVTGRHLECLGTWDPVPEKDGNKHLLLNIERAQYWLAQGARPSDTVARIFGQAGVLPPLPFRPALPRATKNPDKWRKTSG